MPSDQATAAVPPDPRTLDFDLIYRQHVDLARRSAAALGVSAYALDDVVQETFLVLHRRLPELESYASLKGWIVGIVRNAVRRRRRTLARRAPHELERRAPTELDEIPATDEDPYHAALRAEDFGLACRLLARLDPQKREVLWLSAVEELSIPEISSTLGINLNTAYSRLRLAREDLRRALERVRRDA